MAETFHLFPKLPKELRLQVWEQAMIEARPDRRIIVYQLRVVPFKQSISPLLLVNHESRTCAKAFYNVKLDVYAIPPLDDSQMEILDKQKQWNRIPGIERAVDGKIHGYTDEWVEEEIDMKRAAFELSLRRALRSSREADQMAREIDHEEKNYTVDLEEHWADYVEEQLRAFGSESSDKAETLGQIKGAFYISPEHDVFIEGYDCGRHFHSDNASKIFGAGLRQRVACYHVSAWLNAATCVRVSTLVQVRLRNSIGVHCVFASDRVTQVIHESFPYSHESLLGWSLKKSLNDFPSVNYYFTLRPASCNDTDLLRQLTGADGPGLSKALDQWVNMGSSLDRKGRTAWSFEKTKGLGKFDSHLELVNWKRELMAQWDVGEAESVCVLLATEQ